MKIYMIALLVVIAVAFALAIEDGVESQPANKDEYLKVAPAENPRSEQFLICDIPILGINRTICGISCIAKRYDGGSCNNGTCICQKND